MFVGSGVVSRRRGAMMHACTECRVCFIFSTWYVPLVCVQQYRTRVQSYFSFQEIRADVGPTFAVVLEVGVLVTRHLRW